MGLPISEVNSPRVFQISAWLLGMDLGYRRTSCESGNTAGISSAFGSLADKLARATRSSHETQLTESRPLIEVLLARLSACLNPSGQYRGLRTLARPTPQPFNFRGSPFAAFNPNDKPSRVSGRPRTNYCTPLQSAQGPREGISGIRVLTL